jgi:hypothetical protein
LLRQGLVPSVLLQEEQVVLHLLALLGREWGQALPAILGTPGGKLLRFLQMLATGFVLTIGVADHDSVHARKREKP